MLCFYPAIPPPLPFPKAGDSMERWGSSLANQSVVTGVIIDDVMIQLRWLTDEFVIDRIIQLESVHNCRDNNSIFVELFSGTPEGYG